MKRIVPPEVAEALGYYVYVLRDPRDGQVFYVGKGLGARIFSHAREAERHGERAKLERIRSIVTTGQSVEHLVVRSGLSEHESFVVEQAVIDALSATGVGLTNLVKGHESGTHGLATIEATIARWSAPEAPAIDIPMVFFVINRAWRPDMTPAEVYAITRGHWRVGTRVRERAEVAAGVAFGVVRGVYDIDGWFPSPQDGEEGRWGFIGRPSLRMADLQGTSVRHLVPERGAQNPVRLLNI